MSVITVGGKAYASHEAEIHYLGRLNRGVLEVDWDSKEDSADVYTIGSKDPVDSIQSNRNHSVNITILHDELLGMEVAADGTILDLKPFDITVVYKKAPLFHKQTLYSFKPLGRGTSIKAGDNGALAWKIPGRCQAISPLKPL